MQSASRLHMALPLFANRGKETGKMSMNFDLNIEQTQKLVMTPELHQAITLLQFSALELADYIQEEMNNNPLLEVLESEEDESPDTNGRTAATATAESLTKRERALLDWEDYFRDDEQPAYEREAYVASSRSSEAFSLEHYLCEEYTLHEHLEFQLRISTIQGREKTIVSYLLGNLDANGYLRGELSEHARFLGIEFEEAERALGLLQTFDPAGVGARTLQECLLIQLREREMVPPLAEMLLRTELPALAKGNLREIAHKLHVSPRELQEAVDYIRTLHPRPGANLGGAGDTKYIVPDVFVEKVEADYVILVNDNVPHLVISPFYRSLLQRQDEEGLNSYVKKRLDSALWLIRSIEQRRQTLYRVAREIMAFQEPFLEKGIRFLRPLTLKEIAEQLGIHESTVSRAVANKYVQTVRGLYPLKFFFCGGVSGSQGESHSVLSIKFSLAEMLKKEDLSSPQSDQKLAEILKDQGINLSRRTVTKYREELGIPASYKRRRVWE